MLRPGRRERALALALFVALLPVRSSLGAVVSDQTARKLDPILRQAIDYRASVPISSATSAGAWTAIGERSLFAWPMDADGEPRIPCWVRFTPDRALPRWADAKYSARGQARVRLRLDEIERLALDAAVTRIAPARLTHPFLDVSTSEVGATLVHDASGSPPVYAGYTGRGVLIGVVDTGLDLSHADFRREDQSRVVGVWDQTVQPTAAPPTGFSYGREWSNREINAGVATAVDTQGHGTHVMGIAAGNGSATGMGRPAYRFVGMAPEAELLAVKTDFYTASVADAVEYIFERASAMGVPAVANLSLGHHFGPHDGTEDLDRALAALSGPGRIIVAAAGNEQEDDIHAEGVSAPGDSLEITLSIAGYLPRSGTNNDYLLIDGYYTQGTAAALVIITPSGHRIGPVFAGSKRDTTTPDGGVYVENAWVNPVTTDTECFVQIYDKLATSSPVPGTWSIRLLNVDRDRRTAQLDLWIYQSTLGAAFVQGRSREKLVASPASSDSVIAVGAYMTKGSWKSKNGSTYRYSGPVAIGDIAPFSNHGPRRDGVLKPDVSAPGMGIGAALSKDAAMPLEYVLDDGVHAIDQGTSMAAPHVAGLVALMLEAQGYLSTAQVRQRLRETARGDRHATELPNAIWGAGKIDAVGATLQQSPLVLESVDVTRQPEGTLLRWQVDSEMSSLGFRVLRTHDDGLEEPIGEVGPGPEYRFLDRTPGPDDASYWLLALDSGVPRARFGPFQSDGGWPEGRFALAPPSPNPASSRVHGSLFTPRPGSVSIDVFDVAGRRVRSIKLDAAHAGVLEFEWDGQLGDGGAAPTGLYWLRASSDIDSDTRRVVLIRR
ncbi:MAG: S8 family serine peptidase [Candidatus Eisenbacteria bacterium]